MLLNYNFDQYKNNDESQVKSEYPSEEGTRNNR